MFQIPLGRDTMHDDGLGSGTTSALIHGRHFEGVAELL